MKMTMKAELERSAGPQDCAGCGKRIAERYLLKALELYWHEDCLKCGCCDCRLGEVGSTLFTKGNLILCRRDYLRLFGTTGYCSACSKVIPAFEMVMRARNNVYHLECFACQQCNHRFCVGDKFYLCDNKILCEYDYEERLVFASMACSPSSLAQLKRQIGGLESPILDPIPTTKRVHHDHHLQPPLQQPPPLHSHHHHHPHPAQQSPQHHQQHHNHQQPHHHNTNQPLPHLSQTMNNNNNTMHQQPSQQGSLQQQQQQNNAGSSQQQMSQQPMSQTPQGAQTGQMSQPSSQMPQASSQISSVAMRQSSSPMSQMSQGPSMSQMSQGPTMSLVQSSLSHQPPTIVT